MMKWHGPRWNECEMHLQAVRIWWWVKEQVNVPPSHLFWVEMTAEVHFVELLAEEPVCDVIGADVVPDIPTNLVHKLSVHRITNEKRDK